MTEDDVNTAFRRLYRTKFMLGFFDPPLDVAYNNITTADVESSAHLKLAREVAADSIECIKIKITHYHWIQHLSKVCTISTLFFQSLHLEQSIFYKMDHKRNCCNWTTSN